MKKLFLNIYYLLLPIILGSLIGVIISNNIDYQSLAKPPLSPSPAVFPIAWSIIYLLMGLSYALFKNNVRGNTTYESSVYYWQLFINMLWSIIFFVLKWRFVSVLWIILLLIVVIINIKAFYKKYPLSAYLLIPYLLWLIFATYLNIGVYILN